ncbi:MAG: hypothetical protein JWO93_3065 [Micrococcaceae bacterium]|nr:hypothetical protein [Micrococcaceae bacterium]
MQLRETGVCTLFPRATLGTTAGADKRGDRVHTMGGPREGSYRLRLLAMITRRQAAQHLDIPVEMAQRHGIPPRLTDAELADLDSNPPPWLVQSRANRTGKRPTWVDLSCVVCGVSATVRPKKWWPSFSFVSCSDHPKGQWPTLANGSVRTEYEGIGDRFLGVVDVSL